MIIFALYNLHASVNHGSILVRKLEDSEWQESRDLSISKEGQARYIGSPNLEDALL